MQYQTTAEAAQRLGKDTSWIVRMAEDGRFKPSAKRFGWQWQIPTTAQIVPTREPIHPEEQRRKWREAARRSRARRAGATSC